MAFIPLNSSREKPIPGRPLLTVKDDPAVCVVPRIGLVLAKHGELHPVDGQKLVEGHPEGQGRQNVDLHQGLPAGEVGQESALSAPLRVSLEKKSCSSLGSGEVQESLRKASSQHSDQRGA
jgi:hypothetical protein